jgi:hypothetical protein
LEYLEAGGVVGVGHFYNNIDVALSSSVDVISLKVVALSGSKGDIGFCCCDILDVEMIHGLILVTEDERSCR